MIGQKRLADKVTGILERIEKELDSVEHKIGEAMHVLDTDNDGMVMPLCWSSFHMSPWESSRCEHGGPTFVMYFTSHPCSF